MTERFNRTLLGMLGTLEPDKKAHWHKYVAPLVHAYNCTRHESTGYALYFLMFGRHPRLPVDVIFGVSKLTKPLVAEIFSQIWFNLEIFK